MDEDENDDEEELLIGCLRACDLESGVAIHPAVIGFLCVPSLTQKPSMPGMSKVDPSRDGFRLSLRS